MNKPEWITDNIIEAMAYAAQDEECERMKAEVYNMGWGVADNDSYISIATKTSKGVLTTEIVKETLELTHNWE